MAPKVPVLEVNPPRPAVAAVSALKLSNAAERRIARAAKEGYREALKLTVQDVKGRYRKTGNAYNVMRYEGIRVKGQLLRYLDIAILGPEYIQTQEEGGTILPKKGKFLAVPVLFGQRPDGTAKLASPRSWRNIVKTFIYTSKNGKKFIAYNESGQLRLLYILVEQVEVTKRGFLAQAWKQRQDTAVRAISAAIRREMNPGVDGTLDRAQITTKGRRRRRRLL
jgi:hypothetical protein